MSESHPRLLIFPWPRLIVVLPGGALNVVDFGTWGPYFSTRLSIGCVAFMCGGCSVFKLVEGLKNLTSQLSQQTYITYAIHMRYICDTSLRKPSIGGQNRFLNMVLHPLRINCQHSCAVPQSAQGPKIHSNKLEQSYFLI